MKLKSQLKPKRPVYALRRKRELQLRTLRLSE